MYWVVLCECRVCLGSAHIPGREMQIEHLFRFSRNVLAWDERRHGGSWAAPGESIGRIGP